MAKKNVFFPPYLFCLAECLGRVCDDAFCGLRAGFFRHLGEQSRTIRNLRGPPGALYLMSSAQFHANVHCLITCDRLCVQFAAMTVVQTTRLGMTLRRKGIISQSQGLLLYGVVLILGMAVIVQDLLERNALCTAITTANCAALLRFEFYLNNYALWAAVAFIFQYYLPGHCNATTTVVGYGEGENSAWRYLAVASTAMLLYAAFHRHANGTVNRTPNAQERP